MASTSNTDFWLSLAIFLDVTDSEISALLTEKSLKVGGGKDWVISNSWANMK